MDPVITVFVILALAVVAFITGRIPMAVTAVGVSVALYLTGVLDLPAALSGFGDPTVLFIASLFVVSEALEACGVVTWAGNRVIQAAGSRRTTLMVVLALLVAIVTALISVNGAVAALLPLVLVIAARSGIPSSQLLMPLAFAAHAGSMLALTGTPVNILIADAAEDAGLRRIGFFEFALAGLPLLVGAVLIIVALGPKLLPRRSAAHVPPDLEKLAATLRADYRLDDVTMDATRGVTEVVIPPRSPLVGMHVHPGMCTPSGELVLLGARRGDEPLEGESSVLRAGDVLLLDGSWESLAEHTADDREVLVVDSPEKLRREVPLGRGAKRTLVVLALMVVLLFTGVVPAAIAGLLAAGALILLRVVSVPQAYRSVSWTTVILVAGMIPLSTAFQSTGAAQLIADTMASLVGDAGPTAALALIVLLTLVLGQLISNMATVLILLPVTFGLASTMDVSPLPFLMGLTVAGAAAFLTPVATPANLMVMEPGRYRFGDYLKFGAPFVLLFFAVAVFWVPVVWPFSAS